jgi:hypothetical protein
VEFSAEDVRLLSELAAQHYDPACRQAGQEGGIIRGMAARLKAFDLDTASFEAEFRTLDLLGKIAEGEDRIRGGHERPLHDALVKILSESRESGNAQALKAEGRD